MIVLLAFAILIGALLPVQAGINAQLRYGLGHPAVAALASFVVGTVALAALALAVRAPLPAGATLARIPWWHWTGGMLGAAYIAVSVVLAPRLGAATLIAAVVAGQMVASLAIDHFALVGYAAHAINGWRVAGCALVVSGVILIQRH